MNHGVDTTNTRYVCLINTRVPLFGLLVAVSCGVIIIYSRSGFEFFEVKSGGSAGEWISAETGSSVDDRFGQLPRLVDVEY